MSNRYRQETTARPPNAFGSRMCDLERRDQLVQAAIREQDAKDAARTADELALARMDDDGAGCAITSPAEANCAYVRRTLARREPGFAGWVARASTITSRIITKEGI